MSRDKTQYDIYLDNAATTRLDPEVSLAMQRYRESGLGNASALHRPGLGAAKAVERARMIIAGSLGAGPDEIIFTSGGTESNNLVLKGLAFSHQSHNGHIIISAVEHPSVSEPASWLESLGFEITRLPVDGEGFVDPLEVERNLRDDTILVSIIHGNNEIGTIQHIGEIGTLCRKRNVLFHVDACQSFTKTILDVDNQNIDLVTLNSHKIHGPQGVGALYMRKGISLVPLLHGGEHEGGFRSGTSNAVGIVGFGRAVEIVCGQTAYRMKGLRDYCIKELETVVGNVLLNGPGRYRLCHNINVIFQGVAGKLLAEGLNRIGIYVSTGSACSSTTLTPSTVLTAIGRTVEEAHGAVRLSLSKWTTREEIDTAVKAIARIVAEERENSGKTA
ncbi:MAG: cysteine desulfurase family protein [bacterium]|nr:cysteine desulfurase family protein [bacterium]